MSGTSISSTLGADNPKRSAARRSTKQRNVSSAAISAMAGTSSRVKRPYPRSFAQQVTSTPIRMTQLPVATGSRSRVSTRCSSWYSKSVFTAQMSYSAPFMFCTAIMAVSIE